MVLASEFLESRPLTDCLFQEKEKSDLLQEIQIMQQVGATHPNIVTLLGVCTEKGNETRDS